MKRCILVFFLLLFAGCATYEANYDFDPEADFSAIKTFDWAAPTEKIQADEITQKRLRLAINDELRGRGLIMSSSGPDMLVALHITKEKKVDVEEWGYVYGDDRFSPYYHRRFAGPGEDIEFRRGFDKYEYEVGTIVLDFIDAKTKSLIWRSSLSGAVEQERPSSRVTEVVKKLLENFPPSKQK